MYVLGDRKEEFEFARCMNWVRVESCLGETSSTSVHSRIRKGWGWWFVRLGGGEHHGSWYMVNIALSYFFMYDRSVLITWLRLEVGVYKLSFSSLAFYLHAALTEKFSKLHELRAMEIWLCCSLRSRYVSRYVWPKDRKDLSHGNFWLCGVSKTRNIPCHIEPKIEMTA
jgi:hypothetical protein